MLPLGKNFSPPLFNVELTVITSEWAILSYLFSGDNYCEQQQGVILFPFLASRHLPGDTDLYKDNILNYSYYIPTAGLLGLLILLSNSSPNPGQVRVGRGLLSWATASSPLLFCIWAVTLMGRKWWSIGMESHWMAVMLLSIWRIFSVTGEFA